MIRKKIMFYTMILQKGGTEKTITNLANYFISEYDITIVTNINKKSEYVLNEKIKHICIDLVDKSKENILKKIFTKLSYKRSAQLKEIINSEKPDIILTFLPEPTIRVLALKKHFKKIPMIVCIRNHPTKEYYYPLLKKVRDYYYTKANTIIIQDKKYEKYLNKNIEHKIEVIPNYISEEFILNNKIQKKEKKIVTVTRLEKQKNISLLIKAFSKLDNKFNDYKLYIYGEGSKKTKLEKIVKKLRLTDRIIFLGKVDDINNAIKDAMLFILSSNYEGMPNALLEAMALSLPVISTRSTEVIDSIIKNNENGIVVSKKNVNELTSKIEYVLNNIKKSNSMGKKAGQVQITHNKKNIIKKWESILKKYL